MTPTLELVLPGDPATRTGGYEYDRRIAAGLRAEGWTVRLHPLADSFPAPDADARAHASACFAALPDDSLVLVDGLAFGALPEIAAREAGRLRLVALVHHPLALESGLDPAARARLHASEAAALAHARAVVATSERTAQDLAAWRVPRARIVVVAPGTDPAPLARGSGGEHVRLLCVATVTPRKGHDLLLDALAALRALPWRLDCVGSTERSPATAAALRSRAERLALASRIRWRGELADTAVQAAYDTADVFVSAARHEGYGMAVAEALARGLPCVVTAVGAGPELVGEGAGLLVPPDDLGALTLALERTIADPAFRRQCAAGAARARGRLVAWPSACATLARALATVAAQGAPA